MQKGFVIFYTVLLVLAITLAIAGSMYFITFSNQKIARNAVFSSQAEYAAESGLEDATYRIKNSLPYSSPYSLLVGSAQTTIMITTIGPTKTVESDGQEQNRIRKNQAVLAISSSNISFHYGIQVGSQGISLGQGSSVVGNIFSNGDISGGGKTKSTITGTAQAAGNGQIENITVNGDAYADKFSSCSIGGQASYVSSISNCGASSTVHASQQLAPQDFPISQDQITAWKNTAAAGGTVSGYALGNTASGTLGPKKVNGNITLGNGSTLTITGIVWVTGTLNLGNTDTIQLDPGYGAASGVLILDGSASIGNGVTLKGSGQQGSELMILSTYGTGTALHIGNTQSAGLFYAPNGIINMGNGVNAIELTAQGINAGNNATITYQTGLANTNFSSGPGGSFQVLSWKEIQ